MVMHVEIDEWMWLCILYVFVKVTEVCILMASKWKMNWLHCAACICSHSWHERWCVASDAAKEKLSSGVNVNRCRFAYIVNIGSTRLWNFHFACTFSSLPFVWKLFTFEPCTKNKCLFSWCNWGAIRRLQLVSYRCYVEGIGKRQCDCLSTHDVTLARANLSVNDRVDGSLMLMPPTPLVPCRLQ